MLALAVGAVLVVAVFLLYSDRRGRDDPAEITVFRPTTSFCEEFRSESFTRQLEGVVSSSPKLRPTVARVEADFLGQISGSTGVPGDARSLLERLRQELVSGSESEDLRQALATAAHLDDIAEVRCR